MPLAEWENLASLLSLVVGVAAAMVLWFGWLPSVAIATVERKFIRLADRPLLCFILLPTLSLAVSLIIAVHKGIPQPLIHDEFSYLLAADTFAHGRLTNPTLPCWENFETPQQLMVPTYMSKYPPGQGLALALGQVLTGKPIVGTWLSAAVATLAIYWMMLGFVTRPWALLGGLMAALHPELADWGQMYWGGSVAVLGGALFLGAWGRLMTDITARISIVLAVGMIILANTRPFEGMLLVVPLMISILFRHRMRCARLIVPVGIPLLLAAGAMAYDNFRVTGHALRLPFQEYVSQYDVYPKFWFLPMRPIPIYNNPAMQYIHQYFEVGSYVAIHTVQGFYDISAYRLELIFDTNLKLAVLLLPLSVVVFVKKELRLIWVMTTCGLFVLTLWAENFLYPHYQAPLLPALMLLVVIGWKQLNRWNWRGRPAGKFLAWATAIGFLAGAMMATAQPVHIERNLLAQKSTADSLPQLRTGRHLILVSYNPMHSYHSELVHNLSNLDESRIIWARSLGEYQDRQLARHFADRKIWSLYVGGKLELTPYVE